MRDLPIFIATCLLSNIKAGINKMHNAKWTCLWNRCGYWSSCQGNYYLLCSRDKEQLCFAKHYFKNFNSISCWPEISKQGSKKTESIYQTGRYIECLSKIYAQKTNLEKAWPPNMQQIKVLLYCYFCSLTNYFLEKLKMYLYLNLSV